MRRVEHQPIADFLRTSFPTPNPPPTMTTLAVATTEHLLLSQTASLKRTSSLLSSGPKTLIPRPLAGTWSSDNSTLFLVFSDGIRKYSDRGAVEDVIFSPPEEEELQACIVTKDNSTIIGALSSKIAVLEFNPCSSDYTVVKTIDIHTSPVISLAISKDGATLASTSQTAVYIHTLGIDSHTALRGLPQSSEEPPLCAFSPHFRSKLIVGSGQVLYVYDVTRPSSPTKTIPLGSGANGDVVSLACSPYSKTLVAAICEGGTVHLVDLEKEKGYELPLVCVHDRADLGIGFTRWWTSRLVSLHWSSLLKVQLCILGPTAATSWCSTCGHLTNRPSLSLPVGSVVASSVLQFRFVVHRP